MKNGNDEQPHWFIPLTLVTSRSNGTLYKHLISRQEERIEFIIDDDQHVSNTRKKRRSLSDGTSPCWLKINVCSSAPYRVFYSSAMLEQLIGAIHRQELNAFDRFNLQNDLYALAIGGFTSLVNYLHLLSQAFVDEHDDELVWKDIETNLIRIGTLFEYDEQLFQFYRRYLVDFHRTLFQRLDFIARSNESMASGRLRCFLLVILGTIGNQSNVLVHAREQLRIYLRDSSVSVLWPICAIVAHHASESDFIDLLKLWEERSRRDDRIRCAYGLSYVQDGSQIARVLDLFSNQSSSSSHSLRLHERIECYKGFCLSKRGRTAYQRYIESNWFALRSAYTDDYLEALIRDTLGYFANENEAKRIEEFFLNADPFVSIGKETPATPCTRITQHLSLDDQELSSLGRNQMPSPDLPNARPIMPAKVKEVAKILVHTTRSRIALLERDREKLLTFFRNEFPTRSISPNAADLSNRLSNVHRRKRRRSSPPVRNLLASDATA
jgi:hypothetical protein